jgi:hypothetical protein
MTAMTAMTAVAAVVADASLTAFMSAGMEARQQPGEPCGQQQRLAAAVKARVP